VALGRDGGNGLLDVIFSENIGESIKLIESGEFNLDEKDNEGFTALHAAALRKLVEVVEVLIAHGADVNAIDGWGNPPILRALGSNPGSTSIIDMLLEAGADIHIKNHSDNSVATHVKKIKGHPNYEQLKSYL
jgi:uncharacterized protein